MTTARNASELRLPWWVQPLNRVLHALNTVGLPVPGAHVLRYTGRRTGKVRDVVITPFTHTGQQYVIVGIPGSAWSLNLRPAGTAELRHGKRATPVRLSEVTDAAEKREVMRAYPAIQPLGVYPFRIMGHVSSSDPDEWEKAASLVELFRIDPASWRRISLFQHVMKNGSAGGAMLKRRPNQGGEENVDRNFPTPSTLRVS